MAEAKTLSSSFKAAMSHLTGRVLNGAASISQAAQNTYRFFKYNAATITGTGGGAFLGYALLTGAMAAGVLPVGLAAGVIIACCCIYLGSLIDSDIDYRRTRFNGHTRGFDAYNLKHQIFG